jgi:hypothetical protein
MTQQNPVPGPPDPSFQPPPIVPYLTPSLNPTGAVCPACGSPHAKKVSFTWWGGVLGPRLFNHVKCLACGVGYNGKNGKSNTIAITLYLVIGGIIGLIIFAMFVFVR